MMEYKDGVHKFNLFLKLHRTQLESSGVPEKFWRALFVKLENQVLDAGNAFGLFRVEYEGLKNYEDPVFTVLVTKENGIKCDDPEHIYLIDHAWTYECNKAAQNLMQIPGLLDRMCNLMSIPSEKLFAEKVESVIKEMWRFNQNYTYGFANAENRLPIWYIMDEFGSAIEHSDNPNFKIVPFYYLHDQTAYSLLFPLREVFYKEKITRDYLGGQYLNEKIMRKALLIPWKPNIFTHIDFVQEEPDDKYFLAQYICEILPAKQLSVTIIQNKRLKVYSDYDLVSTTLTSSCFEIVNDINNADVMWLTSHYKDYKTLMENFPQKFINQYPYEIVLTIKNLMAVVSRRKQTPNKDKFADNPVWFPTTFDLNTELPKFVSYYQHREDKGLNNLWIVKPWNLARGLDITITDNLNCILRLSMSGPKIVQKYIHDPVLFYRTNIGLVKFDIRYVILLKSVKPLCLYVYKKFFLRFSNKPFELRDFWDNEKHFTVMNYSENTVLFKMLHNDFVIEFNKQNPQVNWGEVEEKIFKAFKELFEGAVSKSPPLGIGHNVQSRALYAVDLMLCREERNIQPKLLEVNWMPDCKRACEYYPDFFNSVFLLLFKDVYDESQFQGL